MSVVLSFPTNVLKCISEKIFLDQPMANSSLLFVSAEQIGFALVILLTSGIKYVSCENILGILWMSVTQRFTKLRFVLTNVMLYFITV